MRRESVLVSVIVLSYMAILNVFIAQSVYRRYSVVLQTHADEPLKLQALPSENTSVFIPPGPPNTSQPTACHETARIDIAVVVGPMRPALSNSIHAQHEMLFLALLQAALVTSGRSQSCRVWLVMQAEHYMHAYRVWCAALASASRHTSSCELVFTTPAGRRSAAAHIHERDQCIGDFFLLDAAAAFPNAVLSRNDTVRSGRVVCLTPGCRGLAVYMPPGFLHTAVQESHTMGTELLDTDLVSSAARMLMHSHTHSRPGDSL